jgi:hypothetical protein
MNQFRVVVATSNKLFTGVNETDDTVLRISPQIFVKIQKGPKEILKAWGKLIHEKSPKPKISRQTSFKRLVQWLYLRDYFFLPNSEGKRGKFLW